MRLVGAAMLVVLVSAGCAIRLDEEDWKAWERGRGSGGEDSGSDLPAFEFVDIPLAPSRWAAQRARAATATQLLRLSTM